MLCEDVFEKSIAFDFDGTLIDSKIRQKEVLRAILLSSEINIKEFDLEKWWLNKREGLNTNNSLIKLGIPERIAQKISNRWCEIIEENEWLNYDSIKKGVNDLFSEIKTNKGRIIIITARKQPHYFLLEFQRLFNINAVDDIFIVNPDKSIEQKAEIIKIQKPIVFIGDTENDYFSAKEADASFIGLSDGQRTRSFLQKIGVNTILPSIDKLRIHLKKELHGKFI